MAKCKECGTHFHCIGGADGDFCSDKCKDISVNKAVKMLASDSVDGGGARYNTGKLPIHLVPTSSVYALADVLDYGATKYEDHNWRRGMKWSTVYSCAMRHLLKWFEGEELDDESGKEHLSHVMANIAMLIEYKKTCPELDDRFKGCQRVYSSFKSDLPNGMTEHDVDKMAAEYDPENYGNNRN